MVGLLAGEGIVKRVIALVLGLVIVFGCVTACGASESTTSSGR